ncbi:hypothetical protein GCM10010156_52440 [Planobispora rosea]|uniref:Uncharacterized protein n=1 Tax=Planobispora rosea TaxID=35762 RepID=A0A8J3S624_PLARO|nr:hypothetical protein [Planobispora rosea]GGS87460.1 hypothetical protein GCM10010156_52440 [Planobispora rosea]GIH86646.1 hypothetical protein Pro02_50540 [Planobispora rosea]
MRHPPGSASAWLAHPATVTATILLLINDHLLKGLWPGPITGKLSDLAGLMVAPPLLALIRVPAPAAVILIGVGFTLVKTTETGAALASQAWTLLAGPSRVLADPTDLLALPALGLAWLIWCRSRTEQAVRQARTMIIIPVALIAVTATSAVPPPPSAVNVITDGEVITVLVGGPYDSDVITSRDGGRTWSRPPAPTPAPGATTTPSSTPSAVPAPVLSPWPTPVTLSCVPGHPSHCYRVVPPRLAVDESHDGGKTWDTAWGVSEGRQELLERVEAEDRGGWPGPWRGSQAVAVHPVPGGHVVVAANGEDGIAVRDADGTWRRLGFSPEGFSADAAYPLHAADVDLTAEYVLGFFAGLFAFLIGVAAARRDTLDGSGSAWAAYLLASAGLLLATMDLVRDDLLLPLFLFAGLVCAALSWASAIAAALPARLSARTWSLLIIMAAAVTGGIWTVFTGWISGVPDRYRVAVTVAWGIAITGTAVSALIGRWAAETRRKREDRPGEAPV